MGDLSKNFSRAEFACKCGCGFDQVDPALAAGLQTLRDYLRKPVTVLSGCRCAAHNAAEGGAKHSMHVAGRAADIRIAGVTARELFGACVDVPQFRGFGVDDQRQFVHVDTRDVTARWCYAGGKETAWKEAV